MSFDLEGKTALVTGAAKRLGRAVSLALADAGCNVVLHYRSSASEVEDLARQIEAFGRGAWPVAADIAEDGTADSLFDEAQEKAGPIDILVNNAAIFPADRIDALTWDSFVLNTRINAFAPLVLGRRLAQQGREGAVLNFLDTRVHDYDKEHASYHFSKRLLHSFTRFSAEAFAPKVRVNAIAPGLVLPPEGKDESYLAGLAHTNPLQRYGGEQDIADAALYLLRADFLTGEIIHVDGGRHLRGGLYE